MLLLPFPVVSVNVSFPAPASVTMGPLLKGSNGSLAFAGFVGLIAAIAARWRQVAARWDAFALLIATVVFCVGFLHLASYRALVGLYREGKDTSTRS